MPEARDLRWKITHSKLWKSMFRHDFADTPRTRLQRVFGNVFLHLHPVRIPKDAIKITYSWGLGGISFLLFLILVVSGIVLMFYYRPTAEHAFRDMKDLEFAVTLGMFWRNLHRWSAHAMVVAVILHMTRVFLTGAYKPPREFNWSVGVLLLVMTLFLSYTGYLLPWDQLALWAVTVGANMAAATPFLGAEGPFSVVSVKNDARFVLIGGTTVGEATLIRFYVLHCLFVPFLFTLFAAVHFWRVRKDVFSKQTGEKVDVWPHLVKVEFVAALVVMALLFWLSIVVNAPLEGQANPTLTPNPSKAPWYFVGLQELLVYFDPWIAGVALPTIIILGLMAIPYVDTNSKGVGYYSVRERPLASTLFLFGLALWFTLIFIGYYCRGPNWEWYWPWEAWSHRRIMKQTLLNIPNLWGSLLLAAYVGQGFPVTAMVSQRLKEPLGNRAANRPLPADGTRLSQGFHVGLGLLLAASTLVPLIGDSTLFQTLGTSRNAPVLQWLFGITQGGTSRFLWLAGLIVLSTVVLGWCGLQFARVKDRLWQDLGPIKYTIIMGLLLLMFGVLGKIFLRLLFGVKYILSFPGMNFNI